jgi:hypothetical protein
MYCGYRFPWDIDLLALLTAYDAAGNVVGGQLVELASEPFSQLPVGPPISFDAGSFLIRRIEVMWVTRSCFRVLPGTPLVCLPPVDAEISELIALVSFTDDSVPGQFIRGDSDGDGELSIADPVRTLNYLFLGTVALSCLDAADANDSGGIDLSDATFTLGFMFNGDRAPPAPFPGKGSDPTSDSLGCASDI